MSKFTPKFDRYSIDSHPARACACAFHINWPLVLSFILIACVTCLFYGAAMVRWGLV